MEKEFRIIVVNFINNSLAGLELLQFILSFSVYLFFRVVSERQPVTQDFPWNFKTSDLRFISVKYSESCIRVMVESRWW